MPWRVLVALSVAFALGLPPASAATDAVQGEDEGEGDLNLGDPKLDPPPDAALEWPSLSSLLWDGSLTLRTWSGYNSNPSLSSLNAVGSGFMAGGGDVLIYRLPVDGWEVSFFGMVEHVAYFEDAAAAETLAVADSRFRRIWDNGWSLGAGLEVAYLRQVFDASELEGIPAIVRAEGTSVALRPVVGRDLGGGWRLELEGEANRQWLAEPLDGYWDTGPRMTVMRRMAAWGDLGVSYRYRARLFDTRVPRGPAGEPLDGRLAYSQHEAEASWNRKWGESGRWRTTLRGGFLRSLDNGGGFYDYDRVSLGGVLRYEASRWEIRAEARGRWYRYPVQGGDGGDGERRRRSDMQFSVRGEWKLEAGFRLFAEYQFESSDENLFAADYRVQRVSGGVSLEM